MARSNTGSTSNYFTGTTPVTVHPLTLACWFNVVNVTAHHNLIVLVDNAGTDYWALAASGSTGGDPVQAISNDGSGEDGADSSAGFTANVWSHACGVFRGTADRSAYLNGGNRGDDGGTANVAGITSTSVGAFKAPGTAVFSPINGAIAEAAVWNTDLSDTEVAILATGVCPLSVRPASLIAYWPLYGVDSPEPDLHYRSNGATGFPLTMTGTMAKANHAPVEPYSRRWWKTLTEAVEPPAGIMVWPFQSDAFQYAIGPTEAGDTVFRKTLSALGGRVGARQLQG